MEEGVVVNKYKPKNPYIGRCLLNTKITGDDAPGETWHMVFSTDGMYEVICFFSLSQLLKMTLFNSLIYSFIFG